MKRRQEKVYACGAQYIKQRKEMAKRKKSYDYLGRLHGCSDSRCTVPCTVISGVRNQITESLEEAKKSTNAKSKNCCVEKQ
ncbi:hypothetical protein DVH05_002947 [Phytophthora capsici]|nr:hypothetical protein DVH05_002947 [Phytophthora capsici]